MTIGHFCNNSGSSTAILSLVAFMDGSSSLNAASGINDIPIGDTPAPTGVFTDIRASGTIAGNMLPASASTSGAITARSLAAQVADEINVVDFGADPTGTNDSGAAINAAIASTKTPHVYIPPGTYKISTTISTAACTYCQIRGAGPGLTVLMNSTADLPTIVASSQASDVNMLQGWFSDMTLDRSVTATSGGDGFRSDASNTFTSGEMQVFNIISQNNWNGFYLGNSTESFIDHCTAAFNQGCGFAMDNGTYGPTLQWNVLNCLSQFNNYGFLVQSAVPTQNAPSGGFSSTNPAYVTVGFFSNCTTFANLYQGFQFQGLAAAQLCDIVMDHCWVGSDGADGLYADTYGFNNRIDNCSFELSSTYGTTTPGGGIGPNRNVAAPMVGNGINITANNQDWRITGGFVSQCACNGIVTAATISTVINSVRVFDVGQAQYNIYHGILAQPGHGPIIVNGCSSTGPVNGGNQHTGVAVDDATKAIVSNCDLRWNTIGFQATNNAFGATVNNCFGYNTKNRGVITLVAGQQTYTVVHGITGTPNVVLLSPGGGGVPTGYYTQNVNGASFQVYFPTAPTVTTYLVWDAYLAEFS